MSKVKRFIWLLKRPHLYKELFRRIIKNIIVVQHPLQKTSRYRTRNLQEFLETNSISTHDAITEIMGSTPRQDIRLIFEEVFTEAKAAANQYPFGKSWEANLNLLYWLAEYCQATRVLETGVAFGWSSLTLLLSLCNRAGSRLISTDIPISDAQVAHLHSEEHVGCVVPAAYRKSWLLIQKADKQAIPEALKLMPEIDMVHYDSDKEYNGRMWSYTRLWDALKVNGIFVSDDIGDNTAFLDFCDKIKARPIIVKTIIGHNQAVKFVGIINKRC